MNAGVVATWRGPVEVARAGDGALRGPAVLLIHGTPGDWRQLLPVAEDLAGRTDVLLVSRPGVVQRRRAARAIKVFAPTLVQHGDADPVVPLAHARFHAAAIPGAVLDTYEDAGHAFLLTRRAEATSGIARHLSLQEAT